MLAVLNTTSTLFLTILLGFIAGISGLFKRGSDQVLINYVFYIALPLNLFLASLHGGLTIFNLRYILCYGLVMLMLSLLTYVLSRKLLGSNHLSAVINTLAVSQVDGAYFALPLFMLIFNSTALAVPLILIQNIIFFSFGILLLQAGALPAIRPAKPALILLRQIASTILYNPVISLSLLGLCAASWHLQVPKLIEHNIKFIGETSAAVALFSLGLTCAFFIRRIKDRSQLLPLASLSLLKLALMPLIAYLVGKLAALPSDWLSALVLLCASPAATHTYIIAKKYNIDPQIATFNVVVTTILSFATVNFWLYWLR